MKNLRPSPTSHNRQKNVFPLEEAGSAPPPATSPQEPTSEAVHVVGGHHGEVGRRAELLAAFQANVPRFMEYVATVDAEGAGSSQTRFGEDTAYAAETKDLIASRVIHALSPV